MKSVKVNPDLQKERDSGSFDRNKLTYILDGSEDITTRRRYVESLVEKEKEFTEGPDYHFLSREEKYSQSIKKAVHYMRCLDKYDIDNPAESYWFRTAVWPNETAPIGLHSAMFVPSLRGQMTEEQQEKWLARAESQEIIGTYAQTELGHGTYLRGLETTATYDPSTQEFVIHSPTLTSTKWWPGGLGKTSNFAVVMAELYSRGQSHGMHGFLVQLRSLETHQPLPGITVGDIGPKFGYETIDNGFLRFDHVRVPRDQMMMKNSKVLPDGTYVKNVKDDKANYGTMVFVRSMIVYSLAARGLAQACTIAIRYSAVRRQSEMKPGEGEPQVLDYQTQQYKLFPLLASAYAYWFVGTHLRDMYFITNYEIQQGNSELLPELHALSSGLKAFTAYGAMFGIEACRLACGGHGYSQASGLPKIYVDVTPACTYEGENTVLYLQTARYLMKVRQTVVGGGRVSGSVAYLSQPLQTACHLDTNLRLHSLVTAYQHRANRLIQKASNRLQRLQAQGHDQYQAWNLNSVTLTKAAEVHCASYVVQTFAEKVESIEDPAIARVLERLCRLYAAYGIAQHSADFMEDGYMSREQVSMVTDAVTSLLREIRPDAVSLVDAFDFSDHILGSILGRHDGQVYDNLYQWAAQSPLNRAEVHESYYKYLKPLMTGRDIPSKL